MSSKFYPKHAYFEDKNQVCPNSLIFHRGMSDSAKIFILALNGIATSGKNWTPRQCDLQKRLGWGKDKMQHVIAECVNIGYLQVIQNRHKGKFTHNDFHFDTKPSFGQSSEESLSSGASQPKPCFPATVEPTTVKPPLPCSSCLDIPKKNKQTEPSQKVEPPSTEDTLVVVCSSLENEEEKRNILSKYELHEQMVSFYLPFDVEHLKLACIAFDQYAANKKLDNPHGCLRQAIVGAWKPNFTKQDKAKAEESKKEEIERKVQENCKIARKIRTECEYLFTKDRYFEVSDRLVHMKYTSSWFPLNLAEDDCLTVLEYYIESQLKKS